MKKKFKMFKIKLQNASVILSWFTMKIEGEKNILDRDLIDDALFRTLRSLYHFERVEVEEFDLTYQQIYLLKYLRRNPPLRISEVAIELRIPVFGATRLVDQLEKRNLIKRERDHYDKRNKYVSISVEGEDMVQKIEDHAFALIMKNIASFNENEVDTILNLITHLDKILGVVEGEVNQRDE